MAKLEELKEGASKTPHSLTSKVRVEAKSAVYYPPRRSSNATGENLNCPGN